MSFTPTQKHACTELYDFCVKEGIADQALIGKWRKVWM